MKDKIKALKSICAVCGECMTVETTLTSIMRCQEYGSEHEIKHNVLKCSSFFISRDLVEDLSKKERKEIEKCFKPVVFGEK